MLTVRIMHIRVLIIGLPQALTFIIILRRPLFPLLQFTTLHHAIIHPITLSLIIPTFRNFAPVLPAASVNIPLLASSAATRLKLSLAQHVVVVFRDILFDPFEAALQATAISRFQIRSVQILFIILH